VDYGRQRVYFTSEATWRTSPDTVWALALADGSASKVWSRSYPRVNTPVVWSDDSIYVGTDLGDVLAIDVADGSARWTSPYVTGDGPVVGFIFPSSSNRLAFSTANKVHLLEDQGTTAAPLWQPSIPLANPTVPLVIGDEIVVADAEGQVYDLDATNAQPPVAPFASFGEPGRRTPLGLPYYNRNSKLYGVGTAEGVLYVVEKP
jgi:outer membrane protein assembly factor BamB